MYVKVQFKFIITIISVIVWTFICCLIEIPWFQGLTAFFNSRIVAGLIIFCLAFLPGIMISLTIFGIILDHKRPLNIIEDQIQDLTILIAAYNEEEAIYETLSSINDQYYPKKLFVKVIDNNSTDRTKDEILRAQKDFPNINIEYLFEKFAGKFNALNTGLRYTKTEYVVTIDADTVLYNEALLRISNAIQQESKNKDVGAIAGAVLVKNGKFNLLTRMQEWEYLLSIASIKRYQGLFQATLVAQGAFSIYNTQQLKEIGGWPDSIGEDIVLTWNLLSKGMRVYYEDKAIAYTNVPTKLKVFQRQRARWARGMIEGLRNFTRSKNNKYSNFLVFCDYLLFAIDFGVTFMYIPGIILAIFFHNFIIVGPMTLFLFPITVALYVIMMVKEYNQVLKPMNIKLPRRPLSLLAFMITYSIILSPVCIYGYVQEFLGTRRKWK